MAQTFVRRMKREYKRFHGFDIHDTPPPGYAAQGSMRMFGYDMMLPPNFGLDPAEECFENRWLNDVNHSFLINTIEVANIPDGAFSGMAVVEGIASANTCTLPNEDNAL